MKISRRAKQADTLRKKLMGIHQSEEENELHGEGKITTVTIDTCLFKRMAELFIAKYGD